MGIFLATLLLIIQLLFQFQLFTFVFILVLILLVSVAFLSENNRVFVWTLVSFSVGLFAFIYVGRIILETSLSHANLFILTRCLLGLPILLMIYVIAKFNHSVLPYSLKINWENITITSGPKKISVKAIFQIVIAMLVLILFYLMWGSKPSLLPKAMLFALVNGVLVELLWRGVLLTRLQILVGSKLAIIVSSLSCSLAYYLFGYSIVFCMAFFIICLFLGAFTWSVKSLLPAILFNVLLTLMLIYAEVIPLIVIK